MSKQQEIRDAKLSKHSKTENDRALNLPQSKLEVVNNDNATKQTDHDEIVNALQLKLEQKEDSLNQFTKLSDSIKETKRSMLDTLLVVNRNNILANAQKDEINNLNLQLFAQSDHISFLKKNVEDLSNKLKDSLNNTSDYSSIIPMTEEECKGVTLKR